MAVPDAELLSPILPHFICESDIYFNDNVVDDVQPVYAALRMIKYHLKTAFKTQSAVSRFNSLKFSEFSKKNPKKFSEEILDLLF